MSSATKSRGLAWILTFIFTAITIALLIFVPAWSWVPLPFMLTYFVQAMDWM